MLPPSGDDRSQTVSRSSTPYEGLIVDNKEEGLTVTLLRLTCKLQSSYHQVSTVNRRGKCVGDSAVSNRSCEVFLRHKTAKLAEREYTDMVHHYISY